MLKIKEATQITTSEGIARNTRHSKYALHEVSTWPATYNTTASPHRLAEMLTLLIGGPQATEVALQLAMRFKNVRGLARASVYDLLMVKGVGKQTAARIQAALQLARDYLLPEDERKQINSPADAAALLMPGLAHQEQEYLLVLLLDTRNRVMSGPIEVYHGSLNTSLIRVGEVFREAIKANAASIIVAHNHPSGDPSPSPEDVAVTRALVSCGKQLDVEMLDHLLVSGSAWISMKERGFLTIN